MPEGSALRGVLLAEGSSWPARLRKSCWRAACLGWLCQEVWWDRGVCSPEPESTDLRTSGVCLFVTKTTCQFGKVPSVFSEKLKTFLFVFRICIDCGVNAYFQMISSPYSKARRLKAQSRNKEATDGGAGEDAGQSHDPVPGSSTVSWAPQRVRRCWDRGGSQRGQRAARGFVGSQRRAGWHTRVVALGRVRR